MPEENKSLAIASSTPAPQPGYGRAAYYSVPVEDADADRSQTPLAHYLWVLRRRKWPLLLFVVFSVAATIIISSRMTPIYESTATVDVDRMNPTAVVGENSTTRAAMVNDTELFLATQLRLITSDSVLRPAAQKLNIPRANNPDAPVGVPGLSVTRPARTYLILISCRSADPKFAADAANAVAESYKNHSFKIREDAVRDEATFMLKSLDDLQAKMERSSAALAAFQKDLNMVDPDEKNNITSSRVVQLNTEYTAAQADLIKKQVAATAAAAGSVEALEVSAQGDAIRKIEEKLADANQKFADVRTRAGENNPDYKRAANNVAELERQFSQLKSKVNDEVQMEYHQALNREQTVAKALDDSKRELDGLNGKAIEYADKKREADADRKLYDELNRKIQEAGINAGFQDSSIRLADPARVSHAPVFPRVQFNGMVALFASTVLGIAVVFLTDSLDHTLRDPEHITRHLQTEVLGSLPVVKAWRGHLPAKSTGKDTTALELFGLSKGLANSYEEAIRTLRDSILLPHAEKRPRTLLMTSATPREGKSTTAVHLAVVHSQQKRKTLIIDGDLRRPSVYQYLGISNEKGLSNVVNGEMIWNEAVQTAPAFPYLSVLPAGPASRRAADGLGITLKDVFASALKEYDLIICDAPPLLGFAESLQIAKLVDGVVVVALAGQTERTAVASVLTNLRRLKANVLGLALNEVRTDMSERYYYYGYYGKYYSRYYKPTKE